MADEIPSFTGLMTLLANNTTGQISAEDVRKIAYYCAPIVGVTSVSSSGITTGDISSYTNVVCTSALNRTSDIDSGGTNAFDAVTSSLGLTWGGDAIYQDTSSYPGTIVRVVLAMFTFTTGANDNQDLQFRLQAGGQVCHVRNGTGTDETTATIVDYGAVTGGNLTLQVQNNTSGTNHVTITGGILIALNIPILDLA